MRLSVLIPAYNDLPLLRESVQSLRRQTLPAGEYQIVVVDDGSRDGTGEWLRQQPGLTPVILPENRGRAAARNAGLEVVTGEQVVFLDADLTVAPDFLETHLRESAKGVVNLGRVVFGPEVPRTTFRKYMETRGGYKKRHGGEIPGRYFVTCNAMVPREWLKRVGGFFSELRHWGGEDLELGVRLQRAGVHFRYVPDAVAVHHQQRDFSRHLANLRVFGGHNLPLILERHPHLWRELHLHYARPEKCRTGGEKLMGKLLRPPRGRLMLKLLERGEKLLQHLWFPAKLYDLAILLATLEGLVEGE